MAIFTVDLEGWHSGLHIPNRGIDNMNDFHYLLSLLKKNNVCGIFYMLGKFEFENPQITSYLIQAQHKIKSHGYYHYKYEESDREPYANLGFTGGFYFRAFPYWLIKKNVESSGHFYIHLHDIMKEHPKLKNPLMNMKRQIGLKSARSKLERLMKEVKWDEPR